MVTLLLGIGNTLRCDEGVGIHAMRLFEQRVAELDCPPQDLLFIDGGTLSFTLAHYIEDSDNLIVFDAAELRSAPGSVALFVGREMDDYLGKVKRSAHEVGLLDLMDIARLTESLPVNRALVGIQPHSLDWDMNLSEAASAALPDAVNAAQTCLNQWLYKDESSAGRTVSESNRHRSHGKHESVGYF